MLLTAALVLDAIFGEPKWVWDRIPHPAVLMGRAVGFMDETFNEGDHRKARGIVACAILCLAALAFGILVQSIPYFWPVEVLIGAILIAQRSLTDHVSDVAFALRNSVEDGRVEVAKIVGRDTSNMDGPAISRAAIESAAENFSDGVVAPVFWFAVAGLPGILLYKIVNTADSMIGYRTPKYAEFGWAAARLDDVLNWIPARLSMLLIMLSQFGWHTWPMIRKDARLHRSPNAGWPEAAMAGALDVALSGPRSYDGEMRDFPYVNPEGDRNAQPMHISAAVRILWSAWWIMFAISILAYCITAVVTPA